MLHVKHCKPLEDYKLHVIFDNNKSGVIDLEQHLNGIMFSPLRDKKLFDAAAIDSELETVVWPNGADFAPEFLFDLLQ